MLTTVAYSFVPARGPLSKLELAPGKLRSKKTTGWNIDGRGPISGKLLNLVIILVSSNIINYLLYNP